MNIATLTSPAPRELAQRKASGLEITLYWYPAVNSTSIEVYHDATGETIAFPVAPDRALDAFYHPFAHLVLSDRDLRPVVSEIALLEGG